MAPLSKSGPLRQSIGPMRARLAANVKAASQLYGQTDPTTEEEWQRYADDIREAKEKVSTSIEGLQQKDQKWQDLIMDLDTAEEKEAEEQIYQNTALNQTGGYLLEVEVAKDSICRLNRRISVAERHIARAAGLAAAAQNKQTAGETNSVTHKPTAKLPKLTLPIFTGDYLEWQNFWSIFETNVDVQKISAAEKFAYLKMQLKGNASQTIDGIMVNDENYATAIKVLKERYQRSKPELISTLYSQLKKLPAAANKLSELMATYDTCEKLFRQLENAGEDVNANRSLVLEVLGKYPATVIKDLLLQHQAGSHSSLAELRSSLRQLIKQTENLADVLENLDLACDKTSIRTSRVGNDNRKLAESAPHASTPQLPQQATVKSSAFAAATTTNKSSKGSDNAPQKPCYFCEGAGIGGVRMRILFDTGSHRSYITESCATLLGLVGGIEESTEVAIFGTKRSLSVTSKVLSIDVQQLDGRCRRLSVHTIPIITTSPINAVTLTAEDSGFVESLNVQLADDNRSGDACINILIGSDYFWDFVTGFKVSTPSGLYIIQSTLGLLVGGCHSLGAESVDVGSPSTLLCLTETSSHKHPTTTMTGLVAAKSPILPKYPDIDEFWDLESIGIRDDPVVKDDDLALQQFNETVRFDGERYEVRWPWKPCIDNLPTNYDLALRRFGSLAKRLFEAEPEMMKKYNDIIEDQLSKKVIEKVSPDVTNESAVVHYLPHHPITKLSSETTKVRIVYDASAKTNKDNPSLNECMFRGPVMLPDLCAVLIRFCCHPVAILADVEKAYLQIGLQIADRDATRFLWFDDVAVRGVDHNVAVYRFCRVPFGVISSQFLLGATIQYHLNQRKDCVANDLKDNTYVDNVASGAATTESAIQYQRRAKQLFREAGMNLQQWCSNSDQFMQGIPDEDKVKKRHAKVLGLIWDCQDDVMQLGHSKDVFSFASGFTKRTVLQALASIFDPLGWVQPVVLPAKLLLQRLWEDKHTWDEALPSSAHGEISQAFSELQQVLDLRVPRFAFPCSSMAFSVVAFADASAAAYGAAIYVRQHNSQTDEYGTRLFFSKCRLAPRKASAITLPRLELLGVVIALRAAQFVRNAINTISSETPVKIHAFTDSQCVLRWLGTSKPLAVFVGNRVRELQQIEGVEFLYVPSCENPADFNTRGMTASEMMESRLWWHGSDWLCLNSGEWPTHNIDSLTTEEIQKSMEAELKKSCPVSQSLAAIGQNGNGPTSPLGIELTDYSSFRKLLRVTVICLKFMGKLIWQHLTEATKERFKDLNQIFSRVGLDVAISRAEIAVAKVLWLKYAQLSNYESVVECVRDTKHHSLIKQLNLKIDDLGLLRCHSRFQHVDFAEAVCPILLPDKHHLTQLIIREIHERLFHGGVGHTLCQIRREYWIPKGRTAVRRVRNKCILCRKHKGASFSLPNMPPWPRERLSRCNPFQFTGLDYMGPINVKIGEDVHKMWICLFTCLAVRAIHLEYVMDCSAKQFLDCVIRFIGRRGTLEQIISDNAPQFRTVKGTFDRLWQSVLTDSSVTGFAAETGILWKFTTELAPWQGGFYERLLGLVKRALKIVIGRRLLEFSEFVTLCVEVEAVVNTRPLTYVYGDLASRFTLRPSDFLTELPLGMPATGTELSPRQMGEAGGNVVRYWKVKNSRLNTLWRFWQDEYLQSLRERGGMKHKGARGEISSTPRVGQVVLVKDTGLPRGSWKLARVTRLIYSADNAVRSAELRLPNRLVIKRAVNFLYPLEVETSPEENSDNNEPDFEGFTEEEVQEVVNRVGRVSASDKVAVANQLSSGLNVVAMVLAFCPNKEQGGAATKSM